MLHTPFDGAAPDAFEANSSAIQRARRRRGIGKAALRSAVVVLSVFVAHSAFACSLILVERAEQAELRVFFTRFKTEDKTAGKYKRCRIVMVPESGTVRFFVTPFRQDANTIVHPNNWPG